MTNYTIWADTGVGDQQIYQVGEHLKKCAGGSVNVLGIGPNVGQSYGLSNGKGTVGVFMTNGVGLATPNDFELGCQPGGYYQYDRCIFVWPQWIDNQYMSDKNIQEHPIPGEWDWNRSASYNVGGQTATQWFPQAKYVDLVAGKSPEDVAQRICNNAFVTSSGNPGSGSVGSSNGTSSGGSSSGSASSDVSPLLQGEMTFEELVGEICNGIDLMFLTKKSVVVVDDFSSIYAQAKYLRDHNSKVVEGENIKFWQLEEDSYELEINQHGFYNVVKVEYKNGVVEESYDEFVRVYGKIPITYKEPKLDKTSAIMKAKSYLAAHIRDFGMTVNVSTLTDGDIDIGDIVTVDNPQTLNNETRVSKGRDPEYLFVNGVSTNWEGDSYISTDLELNFAPTSPDKLDVPSSGTATGDASTSGGNNENSSSSTAGKMVFNECGQSSDGQYVVSISQPSAGRTDGYNYNTTYVTVFKNKCPRCGGNNLRWDSGTSGAHCITCGGYSGSKSSWGDISEGEVSCNDCCSDFCGTTGWEKDGSFSSKLETFIKPVASSKAESLKLAKGNYKI